MNKYMNTNIIINMNRNDTASRKSVAPVMRKMEVGSIEFFPSVQWNSLLTARQRLNIQESKKFSIQRCDENQVKVTRKA